MQAKVVPDTGKRARKAYRHALRFCCYKQACRERDRERARKRNTCLTFLLVLVVVWSLCILAGEIWAVSL